MNNETETMIKAMKPEEITDVVIKLSEGEIITEDYLEDVTVEELLGELLCRLEEADEVIKAQSNSISSLQTSIENLESSSEDDIAEACEEARRDVVADYEEMGIKSDTLEQELKNEVLGRLSKNLTLPQLELTEESVKKSFFGPTNQYKA